MTSDGQGAPSRGGRAPKAQVGSASDLGPPLSITPEILDHAAVVTQIDIELARSVWLQHAPKPLKDLLG